MFSLLLISAWTVPAVSLPPTRSSPHREVPDMTVGLSSLDRPFESHSTPRNPLLTTLLSIPSGSIGIVLQRGVHTRALCSGATDDGCMPVPARVVAIPSTDA